MNIVQSKKKFFYNLTGILMLFGMLTCSPPSDTTTGDGTTDGTTDTSNTPPMGGVKILLHDLPLVSDDDTDDNNDGQNEHHYYSEIKAILLNLHRVEVYSSSRGWLEAVNLVNANNPDGSFFELLAVRNGATPELGTFQLEKDDYSRVRFYFGDKNYVIAKNDMGIVKEYALEIESEDKEINPQNESHSVRNQAKGYRVENSGNHGNGSQSSHENNDNDADDNDEEDDDRYIELLVPAGFYIDPDVITEITLGVNPLASVEREGKRKYEFDPVINVLNVRTTAGASTLIRAATGGTISISNDVTIDIPPGALAQDTNIAIIPKEKPRTSPYRNEFIDMKNYSFLPHNLTLNSNATLTINYDPGFIDDLNRVSGNQMLSEHFIDIQYFDEVDHRYKTVGRQINFDTNTAVAQINHFSEWTVILNTGLNLLGLVFSDNPLEPLFTGGGSLLTWQLRVNDILKNFQDLNTTKVVSNAIPGTIDAVGNLSMDLIRKKDSTGDYLYYAYMDIDPDPQRKVWSTEVFEVPARDIALAKYKPERPVFIPEVEALWAKNKSEYTPGYPMHPALFMISQFADIVFNTNLKEPDNMLLVQVPGYASSNLTGMLYNDVTLGAYLFYHAAQRHDLCDGRGGTYNKTYTQCNLDFYGNTDNPEAMPFDAQGNLPYPARFPSYYNMASICHNIANAVVRSKCWVIRENFMTAVSTSIIKDGSHVGDQCDDYEFWFNNNPSKPPTDAERQTICSNGQPDMNAMIQYLSTDYPQFSGVSLNESSQLPGVSNIRINKRCPAYYEPYLRLEWDFDPARWSSLTFNDIYFMNPQYPIYIDAAKAQYNRVKIYMSRAPGPGSTSADLWNLLIGLTFGGVFEVPYNTNQAADRILPYYFTRHTSSTLVNHFRDYAPDYDFLYWDYWMNPLPDQIDPWPNGNYQFNVQTSIIGYPNNDPARVPFEIQSEPVSKSYCNHEVLNWCVEPWGSDGRCDSNNMPK